MGTGSIGVELASYHRPVRRPRPGRRASSAKSICPGRLSLCKRIRRVSPLRAVLAG